MLLYSVQLFYDQFYVSLTFSFSLSKSSIFIMALLFIFMFALSIRAVDSSIFSNPTHHPVQNGLQYFFSYTNSDLPYILQTFIIPSQDLIFLVFCIDLV